MDTNSLNLIIKIIHDFGIGLPPALAVFLIVWAVMKSPKQESKSDDLEKIREEVAKLASRVSYLEGSLGVNK